MVLIDDIFSNYGLTRINKDYFVPRFFEHFLGMVKERTPEASETDLLKQSIIHLTGKKYGLTISDSKRFIKQFQLPEDILDFHPKMLSNFEIRYDERKNRLMLDSSFYLLRSQLSGDELDDIIEFTLPGYKLKFLFAPNSEQLNVEYSLSLVDKIDSLKNEVHDINVLPLQSDLLNCLKQNSFITT